MRGLHWALALSIACPAFAQSNADAGAGAGAGAGAKTTPVSLASGDFADYLMLAVDGEGRQLSGYYDDGRCRFVFHGALDPVVLDQRAEFGEAFRPTGKSLDPTAKPFDIEIYSVAKGGFQTQLTLAMWDKDRPKGCPERMSLDRSDNVSDYGMIGVRVVRSLSTKVYKLGDGAFVPDDEPMPPAQGSGVWIRKSYATSPIPPGYVYANWYMPRGATHGGWLREADLFKAP